MQRPPSCSIPALLLALIGSSSCAAPSSVLGLSPAPALAPQSQEIRKQRAEARRDLVEGVRNADVEGFLRAFDSVLEVGDKRSLDFALKQYTALATQLTTARSWAEYHYLHGKAARAVGEVEDAKLQKEISKRFRSKMSDWRLRVLLLDAAIFSEDRDLQEVCLDALDSTSGAVLRRALHYLVETRSVEIADRVLSRYAEYEATGEKKKKQAAERARTLNAFESTLHRWFHVDLATAVDWRNWFHANRDRDDLFEPPKRSRKSSTGLTIFGARIVGKNITFLLDVSGSMKTTDPAPAGGSSDRPRRGRTEVAGQPGEKEADDLPLPPEERFRMYRAKRELSRVIRALPQDVRFNVIAFSSDVKPWNRGLVHADKKNKAAALEFIEGLEPEGITVTDLALEEAFTDLSLDTVYLITDGAPTHVGRTRPTRDLPPDSERIIQQIHKRLVQLNFLRAVRIFSLGFRGAKEDFLEKLARDHGGTYVAIE